MSNIIDIEAKPTVESEPVQNNTQALQRVQGGAVGKPLTVEELHQRLEFIRNVMKREMKEGTDFGKIPGTGDKPSLLQPGAQKLLMTFNLREQVKKEVLRDYPNLHREYEFTLTVFPAGGRPEDGWDGVGTCSTLESKYRYRKAERVCPQCKKSAIIKGKEEYGGGWVCFKRRGGCGAKFLDDDPKITGQPAEDVENEDPADQWNTVRKMAFKRALVSASINATNTSELWTQDLEDLAGNEAAKPGSAQNGPGQAQKPAGGSRPQNAPKTPPRPVAGAGQGTKKPESTPVTHTKPTVFATEATRQRMIDALKDCEGLAEEYFQKLSNPAVLLESETLQDVPLQFVPVTQRQMALLQAAIADFGNGDEAKHAFAPNPVPHEVAKGAVPKPAPNVEAAKAKDPEWFWHVICPIPPKGVRRDDYLRKPDTIRSMYDSMKAGDEAMQRRLWGFARHYDPQPRVVGDRTYPVTEADTLFREALDCFVEWEEKHGKDTHRQPNDAADEQAQAEAEQNEAQADDYPPF